MSHTLKDKLFSNPFIIELMNNVSESIYIYDEKGYTVFVNKAAERYENMKLQDVAGKHINDMYTQDYSPSLRALETGQKVIDPQNSYIINGKECIQDTRSYPIFENETLIGVYTIEKDFTTLKHMVDKNICYQKKADQKKVCFESLVGANEQFLRCIELGKIASKNDASVMLSGYTGTGKEMFAKSIHNASSRKNNPFLAINCAAIPEALLESILFGTTKGSFTGAAEKPGLFEEAKGGTVFLDEINSMPLTSQAKILRAIEERECMRVGGSRTLKIDVRIISSINVTPQETLEMGQLRSDLFYRLSVVNIVIPPLCSRSDDIKLLCSYFINKFNKKMNKNITGIDTEVEEFILNYSWPGNIRQLKHVIESAMSMVSAEDSLLHLKFLPQYLMEDDQNKQDGHNLLFRASEPHTQATPVFSEDTSSNVFTSIREEEKEQIIQMLYKCRGNVSKSARELNINRQSLIYKMNKYGIRRPK